MTLDEDRVDGVEPLETQLTGLAVDDDDPIAADGRRRRPVRRLGHAAEDTRPGQVRPGARGPAPAR